MRTTACFDGTRFLTGGATVVVDGPRIVGVEAAGHELPTGCPVASYDGTLLPGLVETHVHLVADSRIGALERVEAHSDVELDDVVTEALRRQLAAGVTTVRDLGDRGWLAVARRDRHRADEPRIVAAGPPITTVGGHCHYLGGEVADRAGIRAAVRERVERGVDVVKVMASGGMNTVGTDVTTSAFATADLRALVEEAHAAGLPVAAHAHAASAVAQAVEVGVQSLEHASFLARAGEGSPATMRADDAVLEAIATRGIAVCPTLGGFSLAALRDAPPAEVARMRELGATPESVHAARTDLLRRMAGAGVRLVSGADAGISPPKAHGAYADCVLELADVVGIADALVSATSRAAEVVGLGDRVGRLAPGHEADLLVVAGDLEHDPEALRSPLSVRLAGVSVR